MAISTQNYQADQRICVIIPYLGKWPVYFDLFLKSIANHPTLHFYFYTDIKAHRPAYTNVRYIDTSVKKLSELFSHKVGFNCNISSAYKLCEFKPAYGHLFEDDIEAFTHWGFGDIDLIYGNIDQYITQYKLSQYDVLSFRKEYLSGALCIFKNDHEINRLYQKSKDFKTVFASDKFFSFCECNFEWQQVVQDETKVLNPDHIEHMSYIVKKEQLEGNISALFETLIKESIPQQDHVHISNKKVIEKSGKEFLFYHFITEKKRLGFNFPTWLETPPEYFISANGFFLLKQFSGITFFAINLYREYHRKIKLVQYYFNRIKQMITG